MRSLRYISARLAYLDRVRVRGRGRGRGRGRVEVRGRGRRTGARTASA